MINLEGTLIADSCDPQPGGRIRLVALGQADSQQLEQALTHATTALTASEKTAAIQRHKALIQSEQGNVNVASDALVQSKGGRIDIAAVNDVKNAGHINATGGDGITGDTPVAGATGGKINITAGKDVMNTGKIEASGGKSGDNTSITIGDVVVVQNDPAVYATIGQLTTSASNYNQSNLASDGTSNINVSELRLYNQTVSGDMVLVKGITVSVKYGSNGTAVVTISQNGTVLETVTYTPGSGPLTIQTTFSATLSRPLQTSQTVNIARDITIAGSVTSGKYTGSVQLGNTLTGGTYVAKEPVLKMEQRSYGATGLTGGAGGDITLTYGNTVTNTGSIEAKGGQGGAGGMAETQYDKNTTRWTSGGIGGTGGKGGTVEFKSIHDTGPILTNNPDVSGGTPGLGGKYWDTAMPTYIKQQREGFASTVGSVFHTQISEPPPFVPPVTPLEVTPETSRRNPDMDALFQEGRFKADVTMPNKFPTFMIVALHRGDMFFASQYKGVTIHIMGQAMKRYNEVLANGETHQKAAEEAVTQLKQAGVDRETAAALIQQFENENLNIDTHVIEFLKSIQSETT